MDAALVARIGADLSDFRSKMDQAGGIVGGFQTEVSKIGPAIAGAFSVGAIVAFGKAAIAAASEAVDGENRLLMALKGREDIQRRLLRQADQIHASTLFEDDEIIKQQGLLAVMGRSEDQIKRLIQASVQLAAATGSELGAAVEALNKTYEGQEKSLKALDPTLHGFTEAQLKSGEVIDLVLQKYEGFAQGLTEIGSGPLTQFKKLLGEITEEAGKAILPSVNDLLSEAAIIIKSLNSEDITPWQKFYGTVLQWDATYLRELNKEIEKTKKLKEDFEKSLEANPGWRASGMGEKVTSTLEPRKPGKAGGDPTAGIVPDMEYLKEYTRNWFTKEYPELVVGSLSEVDEFARESMESQTDFEKNQYQERLAAFMDAEHKKAETAAWAGDVVGQNLVAMASGQKNVANAVRDATKTVVAEYARQAVAAALARHFTSSSFLANPFVTAATAGLVTAAVTALFSSLGGGGGGGGYGGGSYGESRVRENSSFLNGPVQAISLTGRVNVQGKSLNIIFDRQAEADAYSKPSMTGG